MIRMFTAAAALALASTASFAQNAPSEGVPAPQATQSLEGLALLNAGPSGIVLTEAGLALFAGIGFIGVVTVIDGDDTVSTTSTPSTN
ncbi:hypothetical protein ATO10_01190 [Actibacterium atlanticum]|uniref:Secreted protein n=1 Tax=Actibacterium atlanticum TaxID=1461693 RepID=A0A058ZP54_9RHOB|nr:hypothetical protein [Actibacterium atlanticum]KCV83333.1 hypothetical protein ATO10_01190 [Actibacterium atlanticum]